MTLIPNIGEGTAGAVLAPVIPEHAMRGNGLAAGGAARLPFVWYAGANADSDDGSYDGYVSDDTASSSEGGENTRSEETANSSHNDSGQDSDAVGEADQDTPEDSTEGMEGMEGTRAGGQVVCHEYARLGDAEYRRVLSRESGSFVALQHETADDDSSDGFQLVGFQAGRRVYKMAPSPELRAMRGTVLRTAVGFAYVDLQDPVVAKAADGTADVVNECFAIRASPLGGLGAFAVRDISRCEHVLVERPLVRTTALHLGRALDRLPAEKRAQFFGLHGYHPDVAAGAAERIWTANTFVAGSSHEAVFALASRFNHACGSSSKRNIDYRYDRDSGVLVMTAVRRIVAGEELCISYGKMPRMLYERFGFRCTCDSCGGGQTEVEDVTKW